MQGIFRLMEEGQHIGSFNINSELEVWEYTANEGVEQPIVFQACFKRRGGNRLSGEVVKDWLCGRAPEPNYHFIDALMEKVGISEYNALAFVIYNSGRFNTDTYYLEGDGMKFKYDPSLPHLRLE